MVWTQTVLLTLQGSCYLKHNLVAEIWKMEFKGWWWEQQHQEHGRRNVSLLGVAEKQVTCNTTNLLLQFQWYNILALYPILIWHGGYSISRYLSILETRMATCLVSFWQREYARWDRDSKGAGAAQVQRKKDCFAHVVHVWQAEHVQKQGIIDTKKVC